jgi:hypothetical protein
VLLLQDNIAVLTDAASSSSDKAEALGNLQVLVEPIDNANGEQQQQQGQQGQQVQQMAAAG